MTHRKDLIGALQILYWLVKEEIAHNTKFTSLKDLTVHLDCDYSQELHPGGNGNYSSDQSTREMFQCLLPVIQRQILFQINSSSQFSHDRSLY